MERRKNRSVVILVSIILAFISGCSRTHHNSAWKPVWEVPAEVYYHTMGREMQNGKIQVERFEPLNSAQLKKSYEGVIPRVFQDAKGNYRICWIKKDPLRDSYWYDMYEFSADGMFIKSVMSSIPSRLKEPDHTKIPGW